MAPSGQKSERAPVELTEQSGALAPILNVDELAQLLRLNRKTVYTMIQRGEVPGVRRFGRTYRIHRDTVLGWLAEGQGRAPRKRRSP